MSERLVIGMDVGGTSTRAVLADEQGRILGQAISGTGNYNFVPIAEAAKSFQDAIGRALKVGGHTGSKVDHIVIGIEPQPDPLYKYIKKAVKYGGIERRVEGECSMVGGLAEKAGLSLIAGTGSVGWGCNSKGRTHMTSCWGTIGDEGSAWWLANEGVNAAFWAEDGRGPKTVLLPKLLRHFKVKSLRDACTVIYTDPNVRRTFSQFSRLVMKCAADGDRVSKDIVRRGADQIVHLLATCAKELGMQRGGYRVAATGGLVETGGVYFDLVRKGLKKVHPKSDLVTPRFEPVIGAALIALDVVGVKWTEGLLETVEKTSRKTRAKK